MRERILGFFEVTTELNSGYLAHGVEQGYLAPDLDVDNTARAIIGMIPASIVTALSRPGVDQCALGAAIRWVMYDGITAG